MTAMNSAYHSAPRGAPTAAPVFSGVVTLPPGSVSSPGAILQGSPGTGLFAPVAGAIALTAQQTERARVAADGTVTLGGPPGNEALRAFAPLNALNRIEITGGAVGGGPTVAARGADANIDLILEPKGSGAIRTWGAMTVGYGNVDQFRSALTVLATGHATSRCARLAVGSWLVNQDRGGIGVKDFGIYDVQASAWRLELDIDGKVRVPRALEMVPGPSGGTSLQAVGAAAGSPPTLSATGADAVVHLTLKPKGGGTIILTSLPTSPTGLPAGGLWNDAGVLRII